jgi:hypothetical protein
MTTSHPDDILRFSNLSEVSEALRLSNTVDEYLMHQYVGSLNETERARLERAVRAAYLDGEPDGPRSYAALAWAVKGVAP